MSTPYEVRFWAKVDKTESGCWLWTATRHPHGYGHFRLNGTTQRAHRVAYELLVGPIPAGLELDHTCHTNDSKCAGGAKCLHRRCVNPAHLELITHIENCRRSRQTQPDPEFAASYSHCGQGHEYTSENTYFDSRGWRKCRTCNRESARRYAAKKKADRNR